MASGVGLMGEAGPEAILPLSRLPGGDLGVKAEVGGSVEVHIHNGTDAPVQTQTSQGGRRLDVMIGEAVASDIRNGGPTGKAIQDTFSLRRRTAGR